MNPHCRYLLFGCFLFVLTTSVCTAHPMDEWLASHPRVAAAITWRSIGENSGRPYSQWTEEEKKALRRHHDAAAAQAWLPLVDPPPNQASSETGGDPTLTLLTPQAARDLFLASVGHSLALETTRRVPWSVADFTHEQLTELFSSSSFYHPDAARGGYRIWCGQHGNVVPAPPGIAWTFLKDQGLLRNNRRATLLAVCEWSRQLTHYSSPVGADAEDFFLHWQYRGKTPVSRMIAGTKFSGWNGMPADTTPRHYTAGCHGTAGFLKSVLRAVNLPVLEVHVEGHATIQFPTERLALPHGDDLYSQLTVNAPTASILIDLDQWNQWFGDSLPWQQRESNINRQSVELALRYPSPFLTEQGRLDRAENRSREASRVYQVFEKLFTVEVVDQAGVWARLDQELGK